MRFQDEHVADPGERRAIGDDAGEADLPFVVIEPEGDRMLDGPADDRLRDLGRPVGRAQGTPRSRRCRGGAGSRADRESSAPPLDAAFDKAMRPRVLGGHHLQFYRRLCGALAVRYTAAS